MTREKFKKYEEAINNSGFLKFIYCDEGIIIFNNTSYYSIKLYYKPKICNGIKVYGIKNTFRPVYIDLSLYCVIIKYLNDLLMKENDVKRSIVIELPEHLVDSNVTCFGEIVSDMVKLYAKKNHDYGNSFDEGCDKIGTGYPLGRLLDKMNRLISCMGKEDEMQVNESIEDTLTDLACYSVMTLSYLKRKNNK